MTNIMRNLLTQKPVSFNELLDLFAAYVATIEEPLQKSVTLIADQFNYTYGDIFGHICGVSQDAGTMAKHIQRIRSDRNRGCDVSVTLQSGDAAMLSHAIKETGRVIEDAGRVFVFLQNRAEAADAEEDFEATAIISLAARALEHTEEQVSELRLFAAKLAKAGSYVQAEKPVEVEVVA